MSDKFSEKDLIWKKMEPLQLDSAFPGSNFWQKFSYDNDGSGKKSRNHRYFVEK